MTAHDPACPLDDMPTFDCTVCRAIGAARSEERAIFQRTWKDNLPSICQRNYAEGYKDATEHRPSRYA